MRTRRDSRQRDRWATWARCGSCRSGTLWRCRSRDRAIRSLSAPPALLAGGPRVAAPGSGPLEAVALAAMPPRALQLEATPLKGAPAAGVATGAGITGSTPETASPGASGGTGSGGGFGTSGVVAGRPVGFRRPQARIGRRASPRTALRPMMYVAPVSRGREPGAARSRGTAWMRRSPRTDRASRRRGEPGRRRGPEARGTGGEPASHARGESAHRGDGTTVGHDREREGVPARLPGSRPLARHPHGSDSRRERRPRRRRR